MNFYYSNITTHAMKEKEKKVEAEKSRKRKKKG